MDQFRPPAFSLQNTSGCLEQPRQQQNQEKPDIVSPQASCHRLDGGNGEPRQSKILPQLVHPMGRFEEIARGKNPAVVVSFDETYSAAVNVKEPITSRFDKQQQKN